LSGGFVSCSMKRGIPFRDIAVGSKIGSSKARSRKMSSLYYDKNYGLNAMEIRGLTWEALIRELLVRVHPDKMLPLSVVISKQP